MVVLAEKFSGRGSQKGWDFEMVERCGKYAIYKKTSESIVVYEVIVVQFQKAKVANFAGVAVQYPDREVYPYDEQFGSLAWTYRNISAARVRYEQLLSESKVVQKATV